MVVDAERENGQNYTYLLRARPDQLFLARFPPAADLYAQQSQGRELLLLLDDIFAIAPRRHAESLFLAPKVAYESCASVEARTAGSQLPSMQRMVAGDMGVVAVHHKDYFS